MSILRKPYEISLWKDEWVAQTNSTPAHFKEVRVMTIGSSDMEYQGRATEPNLVRKTNGEVSFSFKMYYQFVDTMTGEDIHNPFVDHITNESKIKLNYNDEWFDLLVKNIVEDSATKSYTYQLVDQHVTELSKNGFNIELDSKLRNNLGTAEELATKVLADTDWDVESEKIVATQDEALVMLKIGADGGIQAYRINDTNLTANGAIPAITTTTIPKNAHIYAFYSSCSGEKPYRFQFIYFTGTPEIQSDRIITTQNCQYFIDGTNSKDGWWTGNKNNEGKELETGFTVPKGLWVDTQYESADGNRTAISTKYRGRRYVYTQTSEYHAGLDMYLEKYKGSDNQEYYKYRKTNYVTPNLIQNVVNNAEFKGTSGWKGSKYIDSSVAAGPNIVFKPITSYKEGKKNPASYTRKQWETYTTPYAQIDTWTVGTENGVAAKDRLVVGDYFYFTDAVISDENNQPIYPLFQALESSGDLWKAISMGYTTTKTTGDIITRQPLSSPEFSATVESISMKEVTTGEGEQKRVIGYSSAIDAMLRGEAVIGDSGYNAYLLCGNLHKNIQINGSGTSAKEETIGQKTIINSGTSNTISFQQGITEKEKYRFVLDASLIRKETTYGNTTTTTYSTSWTGKPAVTFDMKIAKHEYQSSLNGFSLNDYNADEFSESVLFVSKEKSLSNTSLSFDLEALGTVSGKSMEDANYQLILNFSNVPKPSVYNDDENKIYTIYEYYILIKKIQFYKLYNKANGTYYSLEDEISTENISYNIEEKYFPVIANDTRELKDIEFASVGISVKPILSSDGARKSSVNAKESNYFNIIQSIAETFECWPKLIVTHDANGNIINKKIKFFNYVGQPNYVGFRYGVNSKDIKRTLDSNQIVSKLIVKANSNEYAPNGFCSIARAAANDTKDNVIYDFGYYVNQKLIDATSLQKDLYDDDSVGAISNLTNKPLGGLYTTTEITEGNVNNYISSCSGYYPKMRHINARLEELSKLISQNSAPLNEEMATYNTYKTMYETAKTDLEDAQNRFHKLAGFAYNAIPADEREKVLESSTLYPILQIIAELTQTEADALSKYTAAQTKKTQYETTLETLETQYDNALFLKATLNKLFYQRYSRFIQEGTWIDESYIEESLYYNDALSVAYNSSMPKVTYSMNVLALASLPGYESFDFKVGDQTFVEDTEFFGYDDNDKPYQEKVTITQTSENLDDPTKNTIQIRNYENQFEDLFQRITATVQSVQYTEGSYKKASALAEADAAHKFSFLTDALTAAEAAIESTDNSITIDMTTGKGITIAKKDNPETEALRLTYGAILLKGTDPETGNKIWKTGLTAQGISASLVTAGTINTSEINIMNGNDPTFRWDTHGITAYDFDNSTSDVWLTGINKNKGVRFDRFGLYGYQLPQGGELTGENWKPTGIYTGANSIEDHSTFYLTWEGLKVKTNSGSTLRIGDNAKVSNGDKYIFKITKKDDQGNDKDTFRVNENGYVEIAGSLRIGDYLEDSSSIQEYVGDEVGKINYVGTNLIEQKNYSRTDKIASNSISGYGFIQSAASSAITAVEFGRIDGLSLEPGTSYTISFVAWLSTNTNYKQWMECDLYPDTLPQESFQITKTPQRFTWTTSSTHEDVYNCSLRFFSDIKTGDSVATYPVYITDIKLEKGDKATDWCPAPSDPSYALHQLESSFGSTFEELKGELGGKISSSDFSVTNKLDENGNLVTTVTKNGQTVSETYESADRKFIVSNVGLGVGQIQDGKKFYLAADGTLQADNALIHGTIYANEGQISGWSIKSNRLTKGTLGTDGFHMYTSSFGSGAYFGASASQNWALGIGNNFGITRSGVLYGKEAFLSGGKIGPWIIGQPDNDSTLTTTCLYTTRKNKIDNIRGWSTLSLKAPSGNDPSAIRLHFKRDDDNQEQTLMLLDDTGTITFNGIQLFNGGEFSSQQLSQISGKGFVHCLDNYKTSTSPGDPTRARSYVEIGNGKVNFYNLDSSDTSDPFDVTQSGDPTAYLDEAGVHYTNTVARCQLNMSAGRIYLGKRIMIQSDGLYYRTADAGTYQKALG